MPIVPTACVSVACDVCGEPLTDPDSEAVVHFDTEAEARTVARALGWPVTSGALICEERDDTHQAAMDGLLPDLQPAGQTELFGEPR